MFDNIGFYLLGNRDQPPDKHSHAWNSGCAAVDRGVMINWLYLMMLHALCGITGTCIYVITYVVELVHLIHFALVYFVLF